MSQKRDLQRELSEESCVARKLLQFDMKFYIFALLVLKILAQSYSYYENNEDDEFYPFIYDVDYFQELQRCDTIEPASEM